MNDKRYKKRKKQNTFRILLGDPGEARTLDPLIKSQLLYQLSYGVILSFSKAGAKVV